MLVEIRTSLANLDEKVANEWPKSGDVGRSLPKPGRNVVQFWAKVARIWSESRLPEQVVENF